MSYRFDNYDQSLVLEGTENGVAQTPYAGIANMQSVNPSTIQGEASVAFATQSASRMTSFSGITANATVGAGSGFLVIPASQSAMAFEKYQSFYITASTVSGITAGTTVYYANTTPSNDGFGNITFGVGISYGTFTGLSGGTSGTVTLFTYNVAEPKFFEEAWTSNSAAKRTNFMLDSRGQVWSDYIVSGSTSSWTYTGNQGNSGFTPDTTANGNGLVYWKASSDLVLGGWDGYLFIFRDGAIDYSNVDGVNGGGGYNHIGTYVYGWNPNTHSVGQSNYLTGSNFSNCPHDAIVGPDGRVYFTDYYNVRKIYQTDLVTPTNFSPTAGTTYTYTTYNLLPIDDVSTCIAPLGTGYIIGGILNEAYMWDSTSNVISNPIPLAESFVKKIVTVNTNSYIFAGNRGNIYVTNGSQADPFAKLPDHISGTVEPYFDWGDAVYQKDRLYFSAFVTNNSNTGNMVTGYGGVWAIDLPTQAMWLSNQLSYGTYTGYASALYSLPVNPLAGSKIYANLPTNPNGYGLLIGWNNNSNYGIDTTTSNPYTGGQSIIEFDLIPIGTYTIPRTIQQIEYKLSTPLVAGESITFNYRYFYGDTWKAIKTISYSASADSNFSARFPATWKQSQWIQIQVVMTSITSNPSYVRFKELRLLGMVGQTPQQSAGLSL